jgi:hypothetical protein
MVPQNQYGKERAEEFTARKFLESFLNLNLELADVGGTSQADYNFSKDNLKCSLEVSRFTEQIQKGLWKGYLQGQEMLHFPLLRSHWLLSARGIPKTKDVEKYIFPALHTLERYFLESYWPSLQSWWFEHERELRAVAEAFEIVGIESAQSRAQMFYQDDNLMFNIGIMYGNNWMYGGPDSALEILEEYIARTEDNLEKLAQTGSDERHLWLWLDEHSLRGVSNAFKDEDIALPSRKPNLPPAVTHLWIVNEVNGLGWRFEPESGWSKLNTQKIK